MYESSLSTFLDIARAPSIAAELEELRYLRLHKQVSELSGPGICLVLEKCSQVNQSESLNELAGIAMTELIKRVDIIRNFDQART